MQRRYVVKHAGVYRSENAGMSSDSPDEKSGCRKSKVSSATQFGWGLVGSKLSPVMGRVDV